MSDPDATSNTEPVTNDFEMTCCVCGHTDTATSGDVFTVITPGEPLTSEPDTDDTDDWYLHIHDIPDADDADTAEAIPLQASDIYFFCPDHLPSQPLPTADEDPSFDIDIFINQFDAD